MEIAMDQLVFQSSPTVTLATNTFVNVPIILQYDETPLISIVREQELSFTTEIPIFHADGTYLAKVKGTRVYPTKAGESAGIGMRHPKGMTVCEMNGKTLFEIAHQSGNAFRTQAELYTPTGYFVKSTDAPTPQVIDNKGHALQVGGMVMSGCSINGFRIGIWLKSDGSCSIGCN
jgi:hypothetical protein